MGINGKACFSLADGFAANVVGEHSSDKYMLLAGFICEVVMTFAFLMIIMGSTHGKAPAGFAPYWSWFNINSLNQYSCY